LVDSHLSPQGLLDCAWLKLSAGSCDGGDPNKANEFFHKWGITDDSCNPYLAVDYATNSELPCEETMCRNCDRFGTCFPVRNATRHYADQFGQIAAHDTTAMMQHIYNDGPISGLMYAHSEAFENYKGGIIHGKTQCEAPYMYV
jgi:cathepsin X